MCNLASLLLEISMQLFYFLLLYIFIVCSHVANGVISLSLPFFLLYSTSPYAEASTKSSMLVSPLPPTPFLDTYSLSMSSDVISYA